ncbi:MAG: hypothetical protein COB67_13045 [SAR324 cluster bacterium]|uniref:DUF2062 domain-containing protein n=1 Tax=SAR324 cluster bacterium TaxID=2024889 RepID=A0A2A4SQ19_9DELT|nr:MAG: hypothetical protein COB67_13045 [SAR324 cluster bacterium]
MQRPLHALKEKIYQNLIKPVLQSVSPLKEAALGSAVGMFVGMTPTVGIQMWAVFMIWLFCKYILKTKFDLVIGTALVWISNPLTMFFLYYGFLVTGIAFFDLVGIESIDISYGMFQQQLSGIVNAPGSGSWDIFLNGAQFLLVDLGFPMILGSLFYATPLAILSYFLTSKVLHNYRKTCAQKMGMDYETWRRKFEKED